MSESIPGAMGMRRRSDAALCTSGLRPLRSEPRQSTMRSGRSPATTSARSTASAAGVSAATTNPAAASARTDAATSVLRAWGNTTAWPIDTRSDRRASGSALVESVMRPCQPSPAALRMIEPMFTGLSTASASTSRWVLAASASTVVRGGRRKMAMMGLGAPSRVAAARTRSPAAYTTTSSPNRLATSGGLAASTNAVTATQPAPSARSTTRSPSATKRPSP